MCGLYKHITKPNTCFLMTQKIPAVKQLAYIPDYVITWANWHLAGQMWQVGHRLNTNGGVYHFDRFQNRYFATFILSYIHLPVQHNFKASTEWKINMCVVTTSVVGKWEEENFRLSFLHRTFHYLLIFPSILYSLKDFGWIIMIQKLNTHRWILVIKTMAKSKFDT